MAAFSWKVFNLEAKFFLIKLRQWSWSEWKRFEKKVKLNLLFRGHLCNPKCMIQDLKKWRRSKFPSSMVMNYANVARKDSTWFCVVQYLWLTMQARMFHNFTFFEIKNAWGLIKSDFGHNEEIKIFFSITRCFEGVSPPQSLIFFD